MKITFKLINQYGIIYVFKRLFCKKIKPKVRRFKYIKRLLAYKSGIEIGGPSPIFSDEGILPIYNFINNLDGCNFSNKTIWEGDIETKAINNFYNAKNGYQYIIDGTDLNVIENSKYEFVISSNCLEHIANPLKAISEWVRIIKKNGILLLILPNKKYCFDHKRKVVKFDHLLNDFENNISENDLSHLSEILLLHDLSMDLMAGDIENFTNRSLDNMNNRALHQHVFDLRVLRQIYDYFNVEVLYTYDGEDYIIVGKKRA
jgi:hypothetical protein